MQKINLLYGEEPQHSDGHEWWAGESTLQVVCLPNITALVQTGWAGRGLDTGGSGGYFLRMAPVTESRDQPGLQRLTPPVPSLLPILKLNLRSADSPIITNRNLSCSIIHEVMLCSTVTRIANSSLIWWTRIWHKTWSLRDSPSRDLTPTSIFWETGTRGTRPGISVLQTAESA